jgi:hypothetical protein
MIIIALNIMQVPSKDQTSWNQEVQVDRLILRHFLYSINMVMTIIMIVCIVQALPNPTLAEAQKEFKKVKIHN